MRISALAAEAGLPVATVKFYLREGLLHAGHRDLGDPGEPTTTATCAGSDSCAR